MLKAHSLTEAQLYLKITTCDKCDSPSAGERKPNRSFQEAANFPVMRVSGHCPSCGAARDLEFTIETTHAAPAEGRPAAINPTDMRSQIIDVGQWLTLSQLFMQESRSETNRAEARLLNLQAAQCLDEALKFYDDPENDLPPTDAFYCEPSRRRFRESPQQFSRTRLISEKGKLPVTFDKHDA